MTARRPRIAASGVATGRGDDGTTGLLFGGPRVAKDDPPTEAYGTIDEAVAALGVARAELLIAAEVPGAPGAFGELAVLGLRLQGEVFGVGAELATTPGAADRRILPSQREGAPPGEWLLPSVNRLADLLWILARVAEQAASRTPVPA